MNSIDSPAPYRLGAPVTEPVLLLGGFMSDARVFSDQILALDKTHALQLVPVWQEQTISEMARRTLASAPGHFALAGYSLGGAVAMEMLRQAPERITRLAVISCSPLSETPQEAAAREDRIVLAQSGKLQQALESEFPERQVGPGLGGKRALKLSMEMGTRLGAEIFVQQSRVMQRRPDQQRCLRQYKGPTLFVTGSHDPVVSPRRLEFVSELLPGSQTAIIDGAGHLALLEKPKTVTKLLEGWLQQPFRLI